MTDPTTCATCGHAIHRVILGPAPGTDTFQLFNWAHTVSLDRNGTRCGVELAPARMTGPDRFVAERLCECVHPTQR